MSSQTRRGDEIKKMIFAFGDMIHKWWNFSIWRVNMEHDINLLVDCGWWLWIDDHQVRLAWNFQPLVAGIRLFFASWRSASWAQLVWWFFLLNTCMMIIYDYSILFSPMIQSCSQKKHGSFARPKAQRIPLTQQVVDHDVGQIGCPQIQWCLKRIISRLFEFAKCIGGYSKTH